MKPLALLVPAAAVLWAGSAHPPATLALAAASALLLLLGSRQSLTLSPLALLPLALALMSALQLLGSSLDRSATLDELAKLLGAACLAVALAEGSRTWLRASLALAGAALLLPALAGFLGVPLPAFLAPIPKSRALLRFPLGNPNHAASLLLLLLPLLVHEMTRRRGLPRLIAGAAWLSANIALVATGSRAGFVLGVGAQAVTAAWLARRAGKRVRRGWLLVGAGVAVGLALAGSTLLQRFTASGDAGRLVLWRDTLDLIRDHLWFGVGRGAFDPAFARYDGGAGVVRHGFVENQYLQVLADGGLLGLALAGAATFFLVRWLRAPERDVEAAALVALAALALHNAVDFSLEAGGVAATACAVAALGPPHSGPRLPARVAQLLAVGTLIAVVLAGARAMGTRADEDLNALIEAPPEQVESLARVVMARHPADGHLAAIAALRLAPRPSSVAWVERALSLAPRDVLAHRAAARVLAASGDLEQASGELRTAISLGGDGEQLLDEAMVLLAQAPEALAQVAPPGWRVALLDRLAAAKKWQLVEQVGENALADSPGDLPVLQHLARGTLAQQSATASRWAAELAARSTAPADAVLVAQVHLGAGNLEQAQRVLEEALARAVETADKIALHSMLGDVAEKQGNLNSATLERERAAQLSRH